MPDGGLLVVMAHPDDESLVGGTMARCAEHGVPVTMLCSTRGEVGEIAPGTGATPATLGRYREQELRDACAILGVKDVRFLEFRDSGMAGTTDNEDPRSLHQADVAEVVAPIVDVMRELRPRAILTWDATGGYGHPDHMKVHEAATAAFDAAADPARQPGARWQAEALYYSLIPIAEFMRAMAEMQRRGLQVDEPPGDADAMAALAPVEPNCIVDVTAYVDRKRKALEAHKTQLDTFGALGNLPDDLAREVFSREYFYRATPPVADGVVLSDIFQIDEG